MNQIFIETDTDALEIHYDIMKIVNKDSANIDDSIKKDMPNNVIEATVKAGNVMPYHVRHTTNKWDDVTMVYNAWTGHAYYYKDNSGTWHMALHLVNSINGKKVNWGVVLVMIGMISMVLYQSLTRFGIINNN